jgi:hypothetical protein
VLLEGANVVRFEALGGDADISLFDTLRLSYWHTPAADDDQLRLTAVAQQSVTINGFATSPIRVVDVTDRQAVLELPATSSGAGPFSVRVQPPKRARTPRLHDATIARPPSWSPTSSRCTMQRRERPSDRRPP